MFFIRHKVNSRYNYSAQYFIRCLRHDMKRKGVELDKKPTLYGDVASPPVRAAMMTASILHYDYKFHEIDLFCSEHKTEFYTKINPLQKVPALAVGDNVIIDSHAILLYMCRETKNDSLYPDKHTTRAHIDHMMYFNAGSLFPIDSEIYSQFFAGKWPAEEEKIAEWYRLLDYLELRMRKYQYLAGDKVFLCDICCAATISSLELLIPCLERHKNVKQWLERLNELPCFEINARGRKRLSVFVEKIKTML